MAAAGVLVLVAALSATWKLWPQPHEPEAFGLSTLNPDSWSDSTKSIVAPLRYVSARGIDDDPDAVELELGVARRRAAVEAERVLEAAAAAALDRDAKHLGLAGRLLRHQLATFSAARSVSVTTCSLGLVSIGRHRIQSVPTSPRPAIVRPVVASETARFRAEERRLFDDWLPFAIYGFFALVIPSSMIVASFLFATRPKRRVRARTIPFESGVSAGPPPQQRFTVSFYLTAMLFILFDIEIVFLYPLAVILHELAWFGFVEFLVFLVILLLAYVYIWRKGALEWR